MTAISPIEVDMATPPPDIAAKLDILRQQAAERAKQDAQYVRQTDRQYTPVIQPNPNWMPKKADGGTMSQDAMRLALMKGGGLKKFLEHSHVKHRVYHGTNQDIKEFDPSKAGQNYGMDKEGMFFTSSPEMASMYAEQDPYSFGGTRTGANVMPVHLNIKNPLVINDKNAKLLGLNTDFDEGTLFDNNRQKIMALAKHGKHDGVQIGDDFIAFHPHQVKSAIGNRGTYNPRHADITMNKGGGLEKFLEPSVVKERMYHGTSHYASTPEKTDKLTSTGIKRFKKKSRGTFLSPDADLGEYTNTKGGPHGAVYPVHVQVQNPFDFDSQEHINALASQTKLDPEAVRHLLFRDTDNWQTLEEPYMQRAIKQLGHDAYYTLEDGRKNLAVYDPKKIKSAIGNRGTYDIKNPDITKAHGGSVTHAHHLEIEERPL